ncbi:MAG: methylenetetrahydrofolate reductase, partial [Anaerolineae bacterium]|nr:methylenetetrahydrofolate reductase [Anaerolineae bacterium]
MGFRQVLQSGRFIVTMDVMPPKGTDLSRLLGALAPARGRVDAINVPDMPSAVMRVGALAVSRVLKEHGFEPILQMTCRDRNRLALQADLLGAAVLGIENVLVLGGDDAALSDDAQARGVFDLDSLGLLAAARGLERGVDMAGHRLQGAPHFCLGAVANPNAPSLDDEVREVAAKAQAGAEFFQTQPIFDLDACSAFMGRVADLGVPVLGGVLLLRSARMARY